MVGVDELIRDVTNTKLAKAELMARLNRCTYAPAQQEKVDAADATRAFSPMHVTLTSDRHIFRLGTL